MKNADSVIAKEKNMLHLLLECIALNNERQKWLGKDILTLEDTQTTRWCLFTSKQIQKTNIQSTIKSTQEHLPMTRIIFNSVKDI
jgi:hypothetical protein